MSKQKKTPWFPPSIKPVRKGVYETNSENGGSPGFNWWDGQSWLTTADTTQKAAARWDISCCQQIKWRGLTSPAKEAA